MKFSIVTPSYNKEKYIAETIESVVFQKGAFDIEYIIIDNCSDDDSFRIAKDYEEGISSGSITINCDSVSIKRISERDSGMYDAINKGFALASGDVHAWINADDIYLPGSFQAVSAVFHKYPDVEWLKGITSYINDESDLTQSGVCNFYNRDWLAKGIYGLDAYFVQQDSVFWRSDLWKRVGGIDRVDLWNSERLSETDFYRQHSLLLDQQRGAGYCVWKAYIILRAADNEFVVYWGSDDYQFTESNDR